jgi:peptide/nickel transport system substrate-binding protein
MFIGGWGWWPDYNDPWNQLYPNFTKDATAGGGSNSGYWINDRFEELMNLARTYENEDDLVTWMKEAQNIATEQDPPVIYYGELLWNTVLYKDVEGFVGNPLYLSGWNFWKMHQKSA